MSLKQQQQQETDMQRPWNGQEQQQERRPQQVQQDSFLTEAGTSSPLLRSSSYSSSVLPSSSTTTNTTSQTAVVHDDSNGNAKTVNGVCSSNDGFIESSSSHGHHDKKMSITVSTSSSSITNGTTAFPDSSNGGGQSASNSVGNSRIMYYDPSVRALPFSQRKPARDAALQEAEMVLHALHHHRRHHQRDHPFFPPSNGYHVAASNNDTKHWKRIESGGTSRNEDSHYLDNFNLLGVVTSPTLLSEQQSNASMMTSGKSSHPRVSATSHDELMHLGGDSQTAMVHSSSIAGEAASSGNFFLDPSFFSSVSAMSTTLSKEIESFNSTLSSYSKTYLGSIPIPSSYFSSDAVSGSLDFETELNSIASQLLLCSGSSSSIYPYVFGEDIIKGQIPEDHLPKEIVDVDLSNVEAYLAKCGSLAEQLNLRHLSMEDEQCVGSDCLDAKNDNINNKGDGDNDENDVEDPTHFVPDIFFSPDFDLTDPKVFSSLLVAGKDSGEQVDSGQRGKRGTEQYDEEEGDDGDDVIGEMIQLQDPFEFTRCLDVVELALLHQVRSKSSSFFRETNRFTELKSLIASSVEEVMALRNDLQKIRERSIADAEMIPIMDKRRKDTKLLKEVLDQVEYVVQVKSSIGEMIQSRNYLEAVERIHLARSLLNGDSEDKVNGKGRRKYALRKITALSKMQDQLTQYENLVVSTLCCNTSIYVKWL
jgi:Protein of unknown function N-terminal domain (DUF2450).